MANETGSIKAAVMGDYESSLPFQAIGVKTIVVEGFEKDTAIAALAKVSREDISLLFITEALFEVAGEYIEEITAQSALNIIPIPAKTGSIGYGLTMIRKNVERAVGMDIFAVK